MITLLERHFGQLVDYEFTAQMEDALDEISRGEAERVPWLRRFYFGDDDQGSGAATDAPAPVRTKGLDLRHWSPTSRDIDARDVSSFPLAGTDIVVRVGRYGPYLERDGQRANVPEDLAPDELTPEKAEELLSEPSGDKPLGSDPVTGHELVAKAGRFGPYVTEVLPGGRQGQAAHRVAAQVHDPGHRDARRRAAAAQSLPRTLGELDGEPVTVQNGRYGPYVKHGQREQVAGDRGRDVHRHARARPRRCWRSPRPAAAGRAAARRRCASSATTRRPASRWWSRTAGSART